jgi:hypothetical protein
LYSESGLVEQPRDHAIFPIAMHVANAQRMNCNQKRNKEIPEIMPYVDIHG